MIQIGSTIVPNELFGVYNPELVERFKIVIGSSYKVQEVEDFGDIRGVTIVQEVETNRILNILDAPDMDVWCIFTEADFIRVIN